jgi:hypothetical protein
MPNTPYVNIQNGSQTPPDSLEVGQPFYWYNPTTTPVTIGSTATWCESDTYDLPAGPGYTEAQILEDPNPNGWAWWEESGVWTAPGLPHVTTQNGDSGPNTPNINIQNGVVNGTLVNGQPFYWYNPTSETVPIEGCGAWCIADEYDLVPGYTQSTVVIMPNTNAYAWTEIPNAWDTPGMPHTQGPITFPKPHKHDEHKKEVA